jgi:hypothetical protein
MVHNIQEATTVENMGRIYEGLDDRQEEHQLNMIKVEGKIINQPIVDRLHLEKSKIGKSSLVQLATGTKRRIYDMVRGCSISLNGVNTSVDLNIIHWGLMIL